jgi:AI-2 transport protein TqsA
MTVISEGSQLKTIANCLLVIAVIMITASLMFMKAVMVPLVLAVFLYFMVSPMVDRLRDRLQVPQMVSILLSLIVAMTLLFVIGLVISVSIKNFLQGAEFYQSRLLEFVGYVQASLQSYFPELDLENIVSEIQAVQVVKIAGAFTGEAMGFIGNFILILIYIVFLLLGERATPSSSETLKQVRLKVSAYVWAKFGLSLATGFLTGIILSFLKVDLAVMFGLLAFLLNFIPSVGSLVATLLPLPIALLQHGMGVTFVLTLALPGAVQFLIGNVIEPKMIGESLDLHPVTLMFFLIFWGVVWGVPGMFLAVPITVVIKILLDRFEATRSLAHLLAGRI